MIISIVAQKGGVGKTTTAYNLASGLQVLYKKKTLLVDMDAQRNSSYIGKAFNVEKSIYQVLLNQENVNNVILSREELDLLPSSKEMSSLDLTLITTGKEYQLKKVLKEIQKEYDYIIIDTPPSLGISTVNALTASDKVIIVSQADMFSLIGIDDLKTNIEDIKEYTNPNLKILGILLTRFSNRAILSKDMKNNIENMAKTFGTKVFKTKIRENISIKESQALQQSIFYYDPKSNGGIDYKDFIEEVVNG